MTPLVWSIRRLAQPRRTGLGLKCRLFSTGLGEGKWPTYTASIKNLDIDQDTRVLYHGLTGKVATANALESIEYGTKIVGGVAEGKSYHEHLGLPVFGSVQEAVEKVKPDVSFVIVRADRAVSAIMQAIEAKVPLVVSVTEHIPVHDMLAVHERLRVQSHTRLVGPNSPGIIAPGRCRIGIMPHGQYLRGCVGIVSKSGTLSYEAAGATTKAGLGQSMAIGVGGDMIPGTTLVDGLRFLFQDPNTEGIILIGEIGGEAEMEAAKLITQYRSITKNPKPVVTMVAGHTAPPGKVMGHSGAVLSEEYIPAAVKLEALKQAGAVAVRHPGEMGETMKNLIEEWRQRESGLL